MLPSLFPQRTSVNSRLRLADCSHLFVRKQPQLVEHGKIKLDDNVNTYLPLKVVNPYFLEDPLTARHLATHEYLEGHE